MDIEKQIKWLSSIKDFLELPDEFVKSIDGELKRKIVDKINGIDNLKIELKKLENIFLENGYTKDMVESIKIKNEANTISDFIDNLQEEQGYWDC